MQEDNFGFDYVHSFRANTILRLLRLASPTPTSPPTLNEPRSPSNIDVEVVTEQKDDLKSCNVNDNILDGFHKVQEKPFEEPKETKMENEPLPRNMESLEGTEEHMEKPKEIHSKKEHLFKSLGSLS